LVFSYGAPLYGSIDPTGFVAIFFTLLFGIMFGDMGQGLVLLLLGLLIKHKKLKFLSSFKNFGIPLIAVGISSMFMGLLYGSVFSNETLLEAPTRIITGALSRTQLGGALHISETEKLLRLMPEKEGGIGKLFVFFGFTIGLGVILNSVGMIFNVLNQWTLKRYEKAVFSKTGIAGILIFWYAVVLALRIIFGGAFHLVDTIVLAALAMLIFFGPIMWRLISGERPIAPEGIFAFVMEGIVEMLEILSSYISNTVSFLRVGAFALSHAVLSFIVFYLSGMVGKSIVGSIASFLIMLFGNAVIIVLEGMIVAIQVTRLQYYEFFSKFFTETGVRFTPFRFRKEE
jgi:V/A-type H+-transporting ATPase subunit I